METLARGDVDIWIARPSVLDDPALCAAYDALLTEEERTQQRAFVLEKNRRESLLTRALVRTALSRYRPVEPGAWRFVRSAHGRPHVDPPCGLRFNLSNHPTMVICAITEGVEIGVDVEPLSRESNLLDLGGFAFSDDEQRRLESLDPPARLDRAISFWTLKESYIKARGKGLSLSLDAFSFHVDDGEPRVSFHAELEDDPQRWWFRTFDVDDHRIGLTVERAGPTPPVVRLRPCVPLRAEVASRP